MNPKAKFIQIEENLRDLSENLLIVTTALESLDDAEIQALYAIRHSMEYIIGDLAEAIENI